MITSSLAIAWIKGRELTPVSSCDTHAVIRSFRHRGVQRFFLRGSLAGIQPKHARRLRLQLGRLDAAKSPREMDLPGWRLHPLRGDMSGSWAVWVDASWRLVFSFDGVDAIDVDYLDYH